MQPNEPQKFAIARAHVNANGMSKTFVLAFNQAKNEAVICCPLEKLQKEHPYGLDEEDIFYRAEPGTPVPAGIA
jgi:hypothetical protein